MSLRSIDRTDQYSLSYLVVLSCLKKIQVIFCFRISAMPFLCSLPSVIVGFHVMFPFIQRQMSRSILFWQLYNSMKPKTYIRLLFLFINNLHDKFTMWYLGLIPTKPFTAWGHKNDDWLILCCLESSKVRLRWILPISSWSTSLLKRYK